MPPQCIPPPTRGQHCLCFIASLLCCWLTAAVEALGSHYCLPQRYVNGCILQGAFMYWYVTFMYNSIALLLFLALLLEFNLVTVFISAVLLPPVSLCI